jgi:hypothetical protein
MRRLSRKDWNWSSPVHLSAVKLASGPGRSGLGRKRELTMQTLLLATAVGAALLFAAGALQAQVQAQAGADVASVRPFPAPVGVDRA